MIYGYDFSTEVIEVNYSNGIGYILLHCCESSLGKDCVVFDGFFEHKLDYELFKEIHNKFVNKKLGKQFGGYKCSPYLCGMENNITTSEKVSIATMKIIYDEFKGLIEKYSNDEETKSMAQKDFEAIETVICILGARQLLK